MTTPVTASSQRITITRVDSPFRNEIEEFRSQYWPLIPASSISVQPLQGRESGMNRVYLITRTHSTEKIVLRTMDCLNKPEKKLWEAAITRMVGEENIGPKLLYLSNNNCMFLEYIEGGIYPKDPSPANLYTLGQQLRKVHSLNWKELTGATPEFQRIERENFPLPKYDSILIQRFQWMMEDLKAGLGPHLVDKVSFLSEVEKYVSNITYEEKLCFCHLDLNNGNILNPSHPYIIDWTLAGPALPEDELATFLMSRPHIDRDSLFQGYCGDDIHLTNQLKKKISQAMPLSLIARGLWGVWDFVGGFDCKTNSKEQQRSKANELCDLWSITHNRKNKRNVDFFYREIANGLALNTHRIRGEFGCALISKALQLIEEN